MEYLSILSNVTNRARRSRCLATQGTFAILTHMSAEHEYTSRLVWEGNLGDGTAHYQGYSRAMADSN